MALPLAVQYATSEMTHQLKCRCEDAKLVLLINRAFIKEDYRREMNEFAVNCWGYIVAPKGLSFVMQDSG